MVCGCVKLINSRVSKGLIVNSVFIKINIKGLPAMDIGGTSVKFEIIKVKLKKLISSLYF